MSKKAVWGFTLAYAVIVAVVASRHELWRDEVRALTTVMESRSVIELFRGLQGEGHPALWYLILYAGFQLTGWLVVLQVCSFVIAFAAAYVFVSRAPFRPWQKALFLLGVFPIYEYSVMCRNYGISMLLLFVFAAMYGDRFRRPLLIGSVIGLLANTNAHSLIIALAIWLSLGAEWLLTRRTFAGSTGRDRDVVLGLVIAGAAIVFSGWQVYPTRDTIVTNVGSITPLAVAKATAKALGAPGRHYTGLFGLGWGTDQLSEHPALQAKLVAAGAIVLSVVIWFLWVYFFRRLELWVILFFSTIALSVFFDVSGVPFVPAPRHLGLFYVLLVTIWWIDAALELRFTRRRPVSFPPSLTAWNGALVTLTLLSQIYVGVPTVLRDLRREMSSSKRFGEYLTRDESLRRAIVIGEPDYSVESLPYYASNSIYVPREGRFATRVRFTRANRQELSLADLLAAAQRVRSEFGQPVVVALGHELPTDRPFVRSFSYGKSFVTSPESVHAWLAATMRLEEFTSAVGDENYVLYLVR